METSDLQPVRSTGDSLDLQLASEVEGGKTLLGDRTLNLWGLMLPLGSVRIELNQDTQLA